MYIISYYYQFLYIIINILSHKINNVFMSYALVNILILIVQILIIIIYITMQCLLHSPRFEYLSSWWKLYMIFIWMWHRLLNQLSIMITNVCAFLYINSHGGQLYSHNKHILLSITENIIYSFVTDMAIYYYNEYFL